MNPALPSQGAQVLPGGGVRYRTWIPGKKVAVVVSDSGRRFKREVSLGAEPGGYRSGIDERGRAGDRYQFRFEGNDWPDPASRFNPEGVHGAAEVIDPRLYRELLQLRRHAAGCAIDRALAYKRCRRLVVCCRLFLAAQIKSNG